MEFRTTSQHSVVHVNWQQQVRNWKASGLSQKQFCRRESLALSTFSYWKCRIEIPEAQKVKFFPLSVPPSITQQPLAPKCRTLYFPFLYGKKREVLAH